jgi:YVTN family beta-propeller protein
MHRLAGVALLLLLGSCFDNLAKPLGAPPASLGTTTISPVTFDAVYVVNGDSATISVIDAERNAVAATIGLQGVAYPHHIAVSSDRALLGVAVPGFDMSAGETGHEAHSARPGQVLLIDAVTGALNAAKTTDAANHNVAFAPDGQVWTSQATTPGSTLVLTRPTLDVHDAISVGTSPAETMLTDDGALAYVANSASSSVSVIDVQRRSVKATINVGAGPSLAQPGPNGVVYVENETDQTISVIDGTKLLVSSTFPLGYQPGTIAVATNGELWIAAPARGGVEIRDNHGSILHFVETGHGAHAIAFSADGTRAYVSNQDEDTVSVITRSTLAAAAKIAVGTKPNGLAWRSR